MTWLSKVDRLQDPPASIEIINLIANNQEMCKKIFTWKLVPNFKNVIKI